MDPFSRVHLNSKFSKGQTYREVGTQSFRSQVEMAGLPKEQKSFIVCKNKNDFLLSNKVFAGVNLDTITLGGNHVQSQYNSCLISPCFWLRM